MIKVVVGVLCGLGILLKYRIKIGLLIFYFMPTSLNPLMHKLPKNLDDPRVMQVADIMAAYNAEIYNNIWAKIIE